MYEATGGDADEEQAALPALLLLVDGRLPSGAHAHSGGMEAAAAMEGLRDVPSMEMFLRGRLATVGVVAAAFAAASCTAFGKAADADAGDGASYPVAMQSLDRQLNARTPSPALRTASHRLGRQLLRAGRAIWPHTGLDALAAAPGRGCHHAVALGAVAAAARVGPGGAAMAAAHDAVVGPATAAVRLLGLDPFAVHAALARLTPAIGSVVAEGARHAHTPPADLPACAGPLADVAAEHHATWEVRLFAS